jgi:hypothetical protein
MQEVNWDSSLTSKDDHDCDVPQPKSPEDAVDQFGIRAALLVLCMALFIAAVSAMGVQTFGKCSALGDPADRHACYDNLRVELLKPPAKGADLTAVRPHL